MILAMAIRINGYAAGLSQSQPPPQEPLCAVREDHDCIDPPHRAEARSVGERAAAPDRTRLDGTARIELARRINRQHPHSTGRLDVVDALRKRPALQDVITSRE